jgi:hypothetical protein
MKEEIKEPTPISPTSPQPSSMPEVPTFQKIIDCKEGTVSALDKVLTINPSPEQLQAVSDYQKKCISMLSQAQAKINQESQSRVNDKLLEAIEKTQNRIVVDNQIVNSIKDSFSSNNGVKLTEEVLGFVYGSKMMVQFEQENWAEYKALVEKQKNETSSSSSTFDIFGVLFLILIISLIGSKVYRLYIKKRSEN